MYFTNIANEELQYFHGMMPFSFVMSLTELLGSNQFITEKKGDVYRIFPMFYCESISSNKGTDKILENKCIITSKDVDNESYFTFNCGGVEKLPMVDRNFLRGCFKQFGQSLSVDEFNMIVYLLRMNNPLSEIIKLDYHDSDGVNRVKGVYADYDLPDTKSFVKTDMGLVKTPANFARIILRNPVFKYATYTLVITVTDYGAGDIDFEGNVSNKSVFTREYTLVKDNFVDIELLNKEQELRVVDWNAEVRVTFDKPVILGSVINSIVLSGDKSVIQSGEVSDIIATAYDFSSILVPNRTIYFYEVYESTSIDIAGDKSIIQTDETVDVTAKLKDEDGSLIEGETIYFYKQSPIVYENDGTDLSTLNIPSTASVTVEDEALKITTSTTGEKTISYDYDLNNSDNFIFECEVAKLGTSQSVAMFVKNATAATGCWFAYENDTGKFGGAITGSSFSNVDTGTLQVGDKIKIKQENGVITLYHNNNQIYSKTVDLGTNYQIGHYTNKDRIQYIKNIKIYELSEE